MFHTTCAFHKGKKPACGCCKRTKPQKNGDIRCDNCIAAECTFHYGNWKRKPRPPSSEPEVPRCGHYIRHRHSKKPEAA